MEKTLTFKGTIPELCKHCQLPDNENHRLNECGFWKETNFVDQNDNIGFQDVFSSDPQTLDTVISRIRSVWELSFGNGSMKKPNPNRT